MPYLRKKLLHVVPVVLLVSFATFVLIDLLPGDPAQAIAGGGATEEQLAAVRDQLHLDDPMLVRYGRWLGDVATGDFGRSFQSGQPVLEAIVSRLPVSLGLMTLTMVLSLAIAIPLGVVSAYRSGGWFDRITAATSYTMISVPNFVLAVLLIYFVGLTLGWLPVSGYVPFSEDPWGSLRSLLMPAMSLAAAQVATFHRVLRSDMLTTLQQDHLLMARAKGLPTRHLLFRHALRPSSFSLLTLAGVNVGRLIGGAVIIEVIFALPGIGQLTVQALYGRDFVVLQAVILFTALTYIAVNTAVDLLYAVLDPRVRDAPA